MGPTEDVFVTYGSTFPRTLTDCARTLNTEPLDTGQLRRSSLARSCGYCGADLTGRLPSVKYCTVAHKQAAIAMRAAEVKTCGWCGVQFSGLAAGAKYCCRQHMRNASSAKFRERNPGYYARYSRSPTRLAYNQANREQRLAAAREYGRKKYKDPEFKLQRRQWWRDNLAKHLEYNRRRRARSKGNEAVSISDREWARLFARHNNKCAYCGGDGPLAKDHIIPVTRGGRHAIGNFVPCCVPCNSSKRNMLLVEWKYRGGYKWRLGLVQQRKRGRSWSHGIPS
jgi:5-methylcytosine-specific restriction endonuclease McrA